MKTETWVEIFVSVVILGSLGYLITKVIDISGTLGGVEVKISNTSDRLERIAQALPDVGIRVAQEELTRPVRTLVITSAPVQQKNGRYKVVVSVVDTKSASKWSIPVILDSRNDQQTIGALAWSGFNLDKDYASFSRMQTYARLASFDGSLPSDIDAKASFVLGSTTAEEYLSEISWLSATPQRSTISVHADNWHDIVQALNKDKGAFAYR